MANTPVSRPVISLSMIGRHPRTISMDDVSGLLIIDSRYKGQLHEPEVSG